MIKQAYRWYNHKGEVVIIEDVKEGLDRGLYPSVTTVLELIYRKNLELWKYRQIAEASLRVKPNDFHDQNSWFWAVLHQADAFARERRENGLRTHQNEKTRELIHASLKKMMRISEVKWEVTKVDPINEYGGTIDGVTWIKKSPIVIEIKTSLKRVVYEEWVLQTAAYANLIQAEAAVITLINPSTEGERGIQFRMLSGIELQRAIKAFLALLEVWHWYAYHMTTNEPI